MPGSGYSLRAVQVAADLDALTGPRTGRHHLPLHLESSARQPFDFADPGQREEAYVLVLLSAGRVEDLQDWLDRDELMSLWPQLYLPRAVRAAWQDRHPVLAATGLAAHVPQP